MALRPFDISPLQVESLGPRFTEFVNRLLEAERARAGLAGYGLHISDVEYLPDGGVDAATRGASATDWIPQGDTAWQFKRRDLQPAACARELRKARHAHDFLKAGGSYVLALGKAWDADAVERRRADRKSTRL